MNDKRLHVISVISNPIRYQSRYKLYSNFCDHIKRSEHVVHWTCEQSFGCRPFSIAQSCHPTHLQVRSSNELWHKENMINLMLARLPNDAEYIAWVDADIEFQRKDWAVETIHQLQHFKIVQMFQSAIDLGPTGEAIQTHTGFGYSFVNGRRRPNYHDGYKYGGWHPGYAWAARRSALEELGGLYDVSALGSGDHLMAWALIGEDPGNLSTKTTHGFRKSISDWKDRCDKFICQSLGYVPGTILHEWHGKKRDRKYSERALILERWGFDPYTDLKRDTQGLYQLNFDGSKRMIGMRYEFQRYFRARNEDSIDLE